MRGVQDQITDKAEVNSRAMEMMGLWSLGSRFQSTLCRNKSERRAREQNTLYRTEKTRAETLLELGADASFSPRSTVTGLGRIVRSLSSEQTEDMVDGVR